MDIPEMVAAPVHEEVDLQNLAVAKPSRSAVLLVSAELIREALRLPAGTEIDHAAWSFEYPGVVELRVKDDDLPMLEKGQRLPRITAELRSEEVPATSRREVRFVRWVL